MKQMLICVGCLIGLLALATPQVSADFQTDVSCQGAACDDTNPTPLRDYQYDLKNLDPEGGSNLMEFQVGLPDPDGITDVLAPEGWTWSIVPEQLSDLVATDHGGIAPSPWYSVAAIRWVAPGDGVPSEEWTNLTFGFNDPKPYVNVTWSNNLDICDVFLPVAGGLGVYTDGPVHAPVPEPSTLVLLGMGAIGLLAYAWRKRK